MPNDPRDAGQPTPITDPQPGQPDTGESTAGTTAIPTLRVGDTPGAPIQLRAEDIERLGQYRLIRDLGAGGMGLVYEAEDTVLHRRVALKVIRPGLPSASEAKQRFLREARAAALVTHDNVVIIHQVSEERGLTYMAMQLLEGETLEACLKRERALPINDLVRIAKEIASGLDAAHSKGLIHRDIKPANIWLEKPDGRVKILDFGLARGADGETAITQAGMIVGTPAYMSPEQSRGEKLDMRSDLFSLGCIMYQMATGERPFDGPNVVSVLRNLELHHPPEVNVKKPQVPAALSTLIMRLIAKDPRDRPATARDVVSVLKTLEPKRGLWSSRKWPTVQPASPQPRPQPQPAAPSPQGPRSLPAPMPEPPRSGGIGLFRILFVLLLLGGGAYYWYSQYYDRGRLTIETDDWGATVEILQNGDLVQRSEGGNQRNFDLPPGKYDLALKSSSFGYKLTKDQVTIVRGGHVTVGIVDPNPPKKPGG